MAGSLVEVRDLSINFFNERDGSRVRALDHVSFDIPRKKTVAMVGESGSGKSVLALALMRLLPEANTQVEGGQLLFEGRDLLSLDNTAMQSIRGNRISIIFQEPMTSLNPVFTVGRQIVEVLTRHKPISQRDAEAKAVDLLDKVGIPDPQRRMSFYPHQMSGGQRQRVMIAMAIACEPQLLIADEPTTALDVTIQKQILDLLMRLRDQFNLSLLFITHDLSLAGAFADQLVVINKGKIVEQGPSAGIFAHPDHPYTKALLSCRPSISGNPSRLPTVSDFMGSQDHIRTPSSGLTREAVKLRKPADAPIIVEARNVSKHFAIDHSLFGRVTAQVAAVDDVSLTIRKGQTLGLVGESGSGKTTLGRTISRLLEPSSGSIFYEGRDLFRLSSSEMRDMRRKIQIIFQDPFASLDPRMTIERTLTEPLVIHGLGTSRAERRRVAEEMMERCGMPGNVLGRYPHEFSGGQRQRICIARALVTRPEFIVCDESVSALDVSVQAQILNLLVDLQEEFQLTYLFISHDLAVVKFIADDICVMNKGKIVETANAADIYERPQHNYTRTLIKAIPEEIGHA